MLKKLKKVIKNIPIIVLGNKLDLNDKRVISKEEGEETAKKYNIFFYEVSAENGENIESVFMELTN